MCNRAVDRTPDQWRDLREQYVQHWTARSPEARQLKQARQIIAGLIEFCEQPEIVEATDGAFDPDALIQRGKGFLSGGEG